MHVFSTSCYSIAIIKELTKELILNIDVMLRIVDDINVSILDGMLMYSLCFNSHVQP